MAIIEQPTSSGGTVTGWNIETVCPAGTHVGVCLQIKDTFDVSRPKYEDPSVTEIVNLTRFLFGVKVEGDVDHMVQTHDLKISGHEKSALMGLLTSWTAKSVDQLVGWDYCEMQGQPALLTIIHKTSQKGRVYASIQGVTAIPPQLSAAAPKAEEFTLPQDDSQTARDAKTPAAVQPKEVINEKPKSHFGGETITTAEESVTNDPPF